MLVAIKAYLSERQARCLSGVSLTELSLHFDQPPEVMRAMLQHWIRKGKVCRASLPAGCGTRCQLCQPESAEVYRWAESEYNN